MHKIKEKEDFSKKIEISNINFFKVDINSDQNKALICCNSLNDLNFCFNYDKNKNSFSSNYYCNDNICNNKYYGFKVNYFPQTDEYIFSCSGVNGNIGLCIFNNNFEFENKIIQSDKCENIEGYSNLYLNENYYLFLDKECGENPIPIQENSYASIIEAEPESD